MPHTWVGRWPTSLPGAASSPCRLLRYGGTYRVVTAELLELLGMHLPARRASARVDMAIRSVVDLASGRYRSVPGEYGL